MASLGRGRKVRWLTTFSLHLDLNQCPRDTIVWQLGIITLGHTDVHGCSEVEMLNVQLMIKHPVSVSCLPTLDAEWLEMFLQAEQCPAAEFSLLSLGS